MLNLILADAAPAADYSQYLMIAVLIGAIVLMYVFSSRSQKKRQAKMAEMIDALAVGNKIKTIGGIYGTIEAIDEKSFLIKSGDDSKSSYLKIDKNAVYASDEVTPEAPAEEVIEVQGE